MDSKPAAYHVNDGSKPECYTNPYLVAITAPQNSKSLKSKVSVWSCKASEKPILISSLEEKLLDPVEYVLLTPQRLLTRTVYRVGDATLHLSALIVHDILTGKEVGSITGLPVGQLRWSASPLLGSYNGSAVIWKSPSVGNGNGVIEFYNATESGLALSDTLQPPPDLPSLEAPSEPGAFNPPQMISLPSQSDFPGVICHSDHSDFPTAFHLSRWTPNSAQAIHASFPFHNATLPDEYATMISNLHDYVAIPPLRSVVLAHEESLFERTDHPTTTLYSINTESFQSNWTVSLSQNTYKVRYIEKMGVILAIGVATILEENDDANASEQEAQLTSRVSVVVVDAQTGAIRARHLILPPELPCGRVSRSDGGCEVDVLKSGEVTIVVSVYGDGQSAAVPVEQFLENGFPRGYGGQTIATVPYPGTPPSEPKNGKQRKQKANGTWSWVERVIFADDHAILKIIDSTAWAVMSWR